MPKLGIASTMSREEAKWRKEHDAMMLAKAKEIQSDPKRLKDASKAMKSMIVDKESFLEQQKKELNGMKALSKKAR